MSAFRPRDRVTVNHPSVTTVVTVVGVNYDTGRLILQPPTGPPIEAHPSQVRKVVDPTPLREAS